MSDEMFLNIVTIVVLLFSGLQFLNYLRVY